MDKHITQPRVQPFVLLLLLEFLIDRRRAAFKGKGSAAELKVNMRDIVARAYPEREPHVPLSDRDGHVPESILRTMREMEEEQRQGELAGKHWCRKKQLFREKNATPGDRAQVVSECLEEVRPLAMCVDRSSAVATTPADA